MELENVNEIDQTPNETPKDIESPKPVESRSNSGSAFYKQKLENAERERIELMQKLENLETEKLQEKENFKDLWEREKAKRIEAEERSKNLSTTVFNNFKSSAIREEALNSGILPSAIEDIDLIDNSLVQVETTDQGRINIHGAKEFVENLKEKKPHWFKNTNAPIINNGNPDNTSNQKELSASELIKLQKSNPAQYIEFMKKRLTIAQ